MVTVRFKKEFSKSYSKIRDTSLKSRIEKQIQKIIENPETGKPMRFSRKGTREVYVPPFRLSYSFLKEEDVIQIISLYHKDEQ